MVTEPLGGRPDHGGDQHGDGGHGADRYGVDRSAVDRSGTLGEVGERAIIAMFTTAVAHGPESSSGSDIVIGSGDDAAVFDVGPTVISTDTAVQGRHFRLEWSGAAQIGARTVVQSAADIAAMGGRTTGVVVALACPPHTTVGWLADLNAGIVDAAHRLEARVLGGDLVAADEIVVSITSVGALDGLAPVTLSGARAGDVLAVSGPLGSAAAGLAVASRSGVAPMRRWQRDSDPRASVVSAFLLPAPDLSQGVRAARAGAHAMTDVSDGLVEELRTMATSSGVSLAVTGDAVPRCAEVDQVAALLGADARTWALTGGEDHELLASFAPGAVPPGWTEIGEVREGPARVTIDGDDIVGLSGWRAFDR
ncbi:thiamine-phosphate kinase [Gordonia polyisoprenivorans]|uniref:thiamine-phosphate kinase n=1 Tax=Gordonia polyisoprenivorans TaxID=84595 RepID=UPI001AD7AEAF|nr:thiamine-phosphate kinase [Gordonia polyisoprenivorans]QTI67746.1 thiamine-phosphate kinase [Gordonia polyisoprenivorans]